MVDCARAAASLTSPLWEAPALRCGCSIGDTSSLHPAGKKKKKVQYIRAAALAAELLYRRVNKGTGLHLSGP